MPGFLHLFDNSGRGGSFLMEFASHPKLSLSNSLQSPRSSELPHGNQTPSWNWQGNSDSPSDFFSQGSVSGTSFPGSKHNMFHFNGTPMTQSSHDVAIHQLLNTSCCFKEIDTSNCSNEVVPDLGLGHISQPLNSQLHEELDICQQGRRHYMDMEHSRDYESSHWSL